MRSFFGEHLSTSVHLHGFFVLRPSHHCGSQRNSSRSETPVPTPLPSFLVIYLQIALEFNCMFWFDHDDRKICSADGHSWHHVHQSSARPKALLELLALFCFFFFKKSSEWIRIPNRLFQSRFIGGPYSLTAVPALEVKPPIARKLRKMATPMV